MTWPLAMVCIVAIVSTLIWLLCTRWFWTTDEWLRWRDQP
jgi:ammonia channel protein AmtB